MMMPPQEKPKIVFPHIMKTAGTSLLVWIQRHYAFNEILLASTWPVLFHESAQLIDKKRFVRGHFGSGILNVFNEEQGFTPIALVRDPVTRVLSHFWHLKKAPDAPTDLGFIKDEEFSFEDFLEHPKMRNIVSNYQVANYAAAIGLDDAGASNHIVFDEYGSCHNIDDLDLDRAKAFIDRCGVVGVTEDLPAFVDALSTRFGFYRDYNLSKHRAYRQEMELSPETLAKVRELNAFDQSLYEYVKGRCDEQAAWLRKDGVNPNCALPGDTFYWKAGMPFWGAGWDDATDFNPPHVWSIQPDAYFVLDTPGCRSGTLIFSTFRFCVDAQAQSFTLVVNGKCMTPVRLKAHADGTESFAVALPPYDSDKLVAIFRLAMMVRFTDINPESTDCMPRGFALTDLRFLPGACQAAGADGFAGGLTGHKAFPLSVPEYSWATSPKVFSSVLCREQHFRLPLYAYWCKNLGETPRFHRKQWEFVFICQVLYERGFLRSGMSAIGFGVGKEPLASYFANCGVRVLATDLDFSKAVELGWTSTDQHADNLDQLNERGLCNPQEFNRLVSFRNVDMNCIPEDIGAYDICWSSCAFEHLGSIRKGLDFVRNSARLLKPGGIAVHTTEYNLSSNSETLDNNPSFVIFRRCDVELLIKELASEGYQVEPIDFTAGEDELERYVDLPPYVDEPHLRLQLADKYTSTSLGIIIRNGNLE